MGPSIHLVVSALLLVSAVVTWPQRADACSYGIDLALVEPRDGATDVPTNVVPWLRGRVSSSPISTGAPAPADGGTAGVVIVMRDDAGAEVPIDATLLRASLTVGDFVEIHPHAALRPDTRYSLEVFVNGSSRTYSFTTGAGPLEETPPALDVRMEIANRTERVSCDDNAYACVGGIPTGTTVFATVTTAAGAIESEMLSEAGGALTYARLDASTSSPFCIELRARNLAGALGPPSTLCSEGAPTHTVGPLSTVTCNGAEIRSSDGVVDGRDDDGCSATGTRGAPWIALGALALLLRRRRRPTLAT